jgi:hypothetical protein
MKEGRGVYRVLVGRPEGKRPQGRPRCRLELAQDRVQWRAFCKHGDKPSGSIKKAGYFLEM